MFQVVLMSLWLPIHHSGAATPLSSANVLDTTKFPVYIEAEQRPRMEALRQLAGPRKKVPDPQFELPFLLALTHYPELKDSCIKIVYVTTGAPIMARPSPLNFLRPRHLKQYFVLIRKKSFVSRIPLDAQVGLIGHELAHFLTYRKKSTLGLAGLGLRYVFSRKFHRRFELDTDIRAIHHGLGPQLYRFPIYLSREKVLAQIQEFEAGKPVPPTKFQKAK